MSLEKLKKYSQARNIADMLDDEMLAKISNDVIEGYNADKATMDDWLSQAKTIIDLTHLKGEKKMYPFENASNVKYPLITLAIIQFASRTLPEVIKANKAVRYKLVGRDDGTGRKVRRGQRVSEFMNFKLLEESSTWIEERDRLFHQVAALGTVFTKTYYNPIRRRVESKLVPYHQIIINNNVSTLEDAPRISHIVEISNNDVLTGQRLGFYSEVDLKCLEDSTERGWEDMPEFIEQHCWLDLDEDGYKEPYMVIIHPQSNKILRIRANFLIEDVQTNEKDQVVFIKAQEFFTDYHFLPNPDGTFFSLGFGSLLRTTNETVNTVFNQLVDAGTLANMQGGFIGKAVRLKKNNLRLQPGEWVPAEAALGRMLKDEIVPITYKEPSQVLFNLMDYLIGSAKELTSTTEALTGTAETQNTSPNTLLALIKQGLTVFTMIQKRMYRGLQKEFKKVYALHAQWTDIEEYQNVLDLSQEEYREISGPNGQILDFDVRSVDITPISDFNSATETERLIQSQGLDQISAAYGPLLDAKAIVLRKLEALSIDNPEALLAKEQPGPDPKTAVKMAELQIKQAELKAKIALQAQQNELEAFRVEAQIEKDRSQAIKNLADAEAAEVGPQLQTYTAQLNSLVNLEKIRADKEVKRNGTSNTSGSNTMVEPPSNPNIPQGAPSGEEGI